MNRLAIAFAILPLLSTSLMAQSYSYSYSWGTGHDKVNELERQIDRQLGIGANRPAAFHGNSIPMLPSPLLSGAHASQSENFQWGERFGAGAYPFWASGRLPRSSTLTSNRMMRSTARFSTHNSNPASVLWQVVRNWESDLFVDDVCFCVITKGQPISINVSGIGSIAETVIPIVLENCELEVISTELGNVITRKGQGRATLARVQRGVYDGKSLKTLWRPPSY